MKPLEKLNDMEIASYFHVSRTPVREAFQILEQQKMIRLYPGKATVVTEMETGNIKQWYLPMQSLQQLAVTIAVDRVTPDHIEELAELNQRFARESQARCDVMGILGADKAFHDCLLRIADNEYIKDFCETLWIHIMRLEYTLFRETNTLEESIEDHGRLIEALGRRDGLTASIAMKENWNRTVIQILNLKMMGRI